MGSKKLEINDLVWAKMKGYPHWPGKITSPDVTSKPKKNHHYVYFFGSKNYAWIADEFIELHSEKMIEKYGQRKGELFRQAVLTITEQEKTDPKHHTFTGSVNSMAANASSVEKMLDKVSNSEPQSKDKSLLVKSSPQKIKKKLSVKKVSTGKTLSTEKKLAKKHSFSPIHKKHSFSSIHKKHSFSSIHKKHSFSSIHKKHSFLPIHKKRSFSPIHKKHSFSPNHNKHRYHSTSAMTGILLCEKKEKEKDKTFGRNDKYVMCPVTPPMNLTEKSEALDKKKIEPTNKKIGFLGLNNIGKGIIKNLCHSGHSLIIWNESEKESKIFADAFKIIIVDTPAEVIKSADLVFSCMTDLEAAKGIIEGSSGILQGLEQSRENKCYIEMTLMDPKMSQIIETDIKGKGGHYLEAPYCGSRVEANEGTLSIVAAGDKTVYDECKSCFDAMSKKHVFISAEVGSAHKLIVIHNMVIGTTYAGLAEALALVYQDGLKGEDFIDVIGASNLSNSNSVEKLTAMVKRKYVANAPLKQIQENFNVGLSLGDEMSQHTRIFCNTNEVYKRCKMMNYGDHDASAAFEGVML